MRFTEEDLRKMGLEKDPNSGRYVKQKRSATKRVVAPGSDFRGMFFIPGNVPSLKNGKRILFRTGSMKGNVQCTMGGKPAIPFIGASKLVSDYEKETAPYYKGYADDFRRAIKDMEPPILVEFVFVRSSKRATDFNNANHMVTDMMVKYGWIADDDMYNILPIPKLTPPHVFLAPKAAGVWITPKNKLNF